MAEADQGYTLEEFLGRHPLLHKPGEGFDNGPARRLGADGDAQGLGQPVGLHAPDDDTIAALVQRGDLVRTSVSVAFAKPVYDDMVAQLRQWFASHPTITVAEWRDVTGTSRKFGLAFLEYLDQQRVTRRVGDVRQLR